MAHERSVLCHPGRQIHTKLCNLPAPSHEHRSLPSGRRPYKAAICLPHHTNIGPCHPGGSWPYKAADSALPHHGLNIGPCHPGGVSYKAAICLHLSSLRTSCSLPSGRPVHTMQPEQTKFDGGFRTDHEGQQGCAGGASRAILNAAVRSPRSTKFSEPGRCSGHASTPIRGSGARLFSKGAERAGPGIMKSAQVRDLHASRYGELIVERDFLSRGARSMSRPAAPTRWLCSDHPALSLSAAVIAHRCRSPQLLALLRADTGESAEIRWR